MKRLLATLCAIAAVAGVTLAIAQERGDDPRSAAAARQPPPALPAPDVALPRDAAHLAATLTATSRRLRRALGRWDPARAVPRDVTYLALHHQRMLRVVARHHALGDTTLARLPHDARAGARDIAVGLRDLASIRRSRQPPIRLARAAPAAALRRDYDAAQRRFGVHWSILAAINFVESAFGRVRSASEAGARGPMQFLPATWRAYGMGGDIDDPRDAIFGAANYLRRSGARQDLDRALFAYNPSSAYVRAIRRFARRMRADERTFLTLYAWQVFARPPAGGARRLTGPGRR